MWPSVSTLWFVDTPEAVEVLRAPPPPDSSAARELLERLYPGKVFEPISDGSLTQDPNPPEGYVYVGAYPGVSVVCTWDVGVERPSSIPDDWLVPIPCHDTYLIATHDGTAWGACAHWQEGTLRRSFSASSNDIRENIGLPCHFEGSYWAGEHPQYAEGEAQPLQALPFRPEAFVAAAAREWLGIGLAAGAGSVDAMSAEAQPTDVNAIDVNAIDASRIALLGFIVHPEGYEIPRPAARRLHLPHGHHGHSNSDGHSTGTAHNTGIGHNNGRAHEQQGETVRGKVPDREDAQPGQITRQENERRSPSLSRWFRRRFG